MTQPIDLETIASKKLSQLLRRWASLQKTDFAQARRGDWDAFLRHRKPMLDAIHGMRALANDAAALMARRLCRRPSYADSLDALAETCLVWRVTTTVWEAYLWSESRDWVSLLALDPSVDEEEAESVVRRYLTRVESEQTDSTLLRPGRFEDSEVPFQVISAHRFIAKKLHFALRDRRGREARKQVALVEVEPVLAENENSVEQDELIRQVVTFHARCALAWSYVAANRRPRRGRHTLDAVVELLAHPTPVMKKRKALTDACSDARLDWMVRTALHSQLGPSQIAWATHHLFDLVDPDAVFYATRPFELPGCRTRARASLDRASEPLGARLDRIASLIEHVGKDEGPVWDGIREVFVGNAAYVSTKRGRPRGTEELDRHLEVAALLGSRMRGLLRDDPDPDGTGRDRLKERETLMTLLLAGEWLGATVRWPTPSAQQVRAVFDELAPPERAAPRPSRRWVAIPLALAAATLLTLTPQDPVRRGTDVELTLALANGTDTTAAGLDVSVVARVPDDERAGVWVRAAGEATWRRLPVEHIPASGSLSLPWAPSLGNYELALTTSATGPSSVCSAPTCIAIPVRAR